MESKLMVRNSDDDLIWAKIKNVPKLSKPIAVFCGVINVILPGTGTITAACMTDEETVSKTQVVVGLMQFLLSLLIVGYIWSWYWSYLLIAKSFEIGEFATGRTAGASSAAGKNARGNYDEMQENNFLGSMRQNSRKQGGVPVYDVNV